MINFKRFFLSFFLGHFFSEIPKIPHQLYNRKALPYLTQKRVTTSHIHITSPNISDSALLSEVPSACQRYLCPQMTIIMSFIFGFRTAPIFRPKPPAGDKTYLPLSHQCTPIFEEFGGCLL